MHNNGNLIAAAGAGVLVTPYVRDDSGTAVPAQQFVHHVVVTGVDGDTPALNKLMKALGHTAYLGCLHCCLNGEQHGGMRFLGYASSVPLTRGVGKHKTAIQEKGGHVRMVEDQDVLYLTTPEQWERAQMYEKALQRERDADKHGGAAAAPVATSVGVHGLSVFPDLLWYSDYNLLCPLPFGHMFFRGVARNFLVVILYGSKNKKQKRQHQALTQDGAEQVDGQEDVVEGVGEGPQRRLAPVHLRPEHTLDRSTRARLRARGDTFNSTADFNHPIRCMDPLIRDFTIEEMMRQMDCVLPLMFAEVRMVFRLLVYRTMRFMKM